MSTVDIMHPELLSRDILYRILTERRVKVDGLAAMSREQLVALYQQFCLPYAQRKKRNEAANSQNGHSDCDNKTTESPPSKRIKLQHNHNDCGSSNKHKLDSNNDANRENCAKRQRTKITWP